MTETSLSTALNLSYMAEQLAIFGIVVGIALILSGIGFLVLALGGALAVQCHGRGEGGTRLAATSPLLALGRGAPESATELVDE